jgi:alkanesulfonate monooxygenase SsuD/methylene tetrahydromethanopterin reductase-like flavin-dependent oxidoreductase (luciferase family)
VLTDLAGISPGALDDDALRSLVVAGDPARCADGIAALHAAGADSVVLLPYVGEPGEQVARVAAELR